MDLDTPTSPRRAEGGAQTTLTNNRLLHEIIHDVNERSQLVRDKEGRFLGMACEGRREVFQRPECEPAHERDPTL